MLSSHHLLTNGELRIIDNKFHLCVFYSFFFKCPHCIANLPLEATESSILTNFKSANLEVFCHDWSSTSLALQISLWSLPPPSSSSLKWVLKPITIPSLGTISHFFGESRGTPASTIQPPAALTTAANVPVLGPSPVPPRSGAFTLPPMLSAPMVIWLSHFPSFLS